MPERHITVNSFKDLIVYQKAVDLSLLVLQATRKFPKELKYDLGSQMRRAAISIPSNITEGYRRMSRKEFIQFLSIAYGSCGELQSQTEIAIGLNLFPEREYVKIQALEVEISKMLWAIIDKLRGMEERRGGRAGGKRTNARVHE